MWQYYFSYAPLLYSFCILLVEGILCDWNEILPAVVKAYSKALSGVSLVIAAQHVGY